jgi:Ca2+-binding RTX toxin-like protein
MAVFTGTNARNIFNGFGFDNDLFYADHFAFNDVFNGGGGIDTLDLQNISGLINSSLMYDTMTALGALGSFTVYKNNVATKTDTISYIENVNGSALRDFIIGDAGANVLNGRAGDDILRGGAGADTLIGGTGIDTADYQTSAAGVTVNLNLSTAQVSAGDAAGDILSEIENVTGSAFNDVLTGTVLDNVLRGGAGNDLITDAGGNNIIDLGDGADTVYAGNGNDIIILDRTGGDFADTVYAGGGDDKIYFNGNADKYVSYSSLINLLQNPGSILGLNTYSDSFGGDYIDAGDGNDTVYTGKNSFVYGRAGDDYLITFGGGNYLDGGDGADNLQVYGSGNQLSQTLIGGAGNDSIGIITGQAGNSFFTIHGGNGDDNIYLNSGHALINGGAGADRIYGTALGIETVTYSDSSAGVTVNLTLTGAQISAGDASGDILTLLDNLTGSAFGDTLTGNHLGNILSGLGGDDVINGGAGADTLDGGTGTDTASYAGSNVGVAVDLNRTTAQISVGDASGDILISIENLIGSSFNDILTGDGNANTIYGGAGSDIVNGGGGTDTYNFSSLNYGGAGVSKSVSWGEGRHVYTVNQGYQTYTDLTTGVYNVFNYGNNGNGVTLETDTLTSIENVTGSSGADYIVGNAGVNVINTGEGSDVVLAGAGDDRLSALGNTRGAILLAQDGADRVTGGSGGDRISGGAGNDILNGNSGNDFIEGDSGLYRTGSSLYSTDTGNDTLYGGDGNDTLFGGFGDDISFGDAGNDFLFDYAGTNTLTGGAGADIFCYDIIDFGDSATLSSLFYFKNTITDFQQGVDKVMIDMNGANSNNSLVNYLYSGANTIVQYDVNHQFIVQNVHLISSDFILA